MMRHTESQVHPGTDRKQLNEEEAYFDVRRQAGPGAALAALCCAAAGLETGLADSEAGWAVDLQLQTKLRIDFTNTEKALLYPSSGLESLLALSHLRHS